MLTQFPYHRGYRYFCVAILTMGYANLMLINVYYSSTITCFKPIYLVFYTNNSGLQCFKTTVDDNSAQDITKPNYNYETTTATVNVFTRNVSLQSYKQPLDAVITYVDGSDPQFLAELDKAESHRPNDTKLPFSASKNRFADNSDLLFLLRSLDKFGFVFRNIYLVVAWESQIPRWLNLNNPRLKVVYHRDIWYNRTQLPVFNSLAVEANLHHIRNLSEIFVYFNDDLAVTQTLVAEDFVLKSPRRLVIRPDFQLKIPLSFLSNSKADAHYINSLIVTRNLLEEICTENITKYTGGNHFVQHSPHVLARSVLYKAELNPLLQPILEATWGAKFRSGTELNTPTFFNTFVQCAKLANVTVGSGTELGYASLEKKYLTEFKMKKLVNNLAGITANILAGKIKFICVNDNTLPSAVRYHAGQQVSAATVIQKWRKSLFPEKSSFEL